MSIVYLNGAFLPEEQAFIPIGDRGFLFGDGVFTTLKVDEGRLQDAPEHLSRLVRHCKALRIRPPPIDESLLGEVVKCNQADRGIWRMKIVITGGSGRELSLPERDAGTVLITLQKVESFQTAPLRLVLYPYPHAESFYRLKTLSYLCRLQVKQFAKDAGADDALVLSPEGYILEAAFSNIYWIAGKSLFTPEESLPLLYGIALQKRVEAAKIEGYSICRGKYRLEEIPSDAKVYLCNAIAGESSVAAIDQRGFS